MSKPKTSKKSPKRRSGVVVAMNRRFSRRQVMAHRAGKRSKDAKNSWQKEWE